jgi:tetratricopeptide (TPR) repeat protein
MLRDPGRLRAAAEDLANTFPQDPRYSLSLAEFYVQARRFDDAIVQFALLENALGIDDGAIRSLKATAAMALGDFERAQEFAQEASGAEPGLELAWWTLLRTRTAAGNYAGATEALTELEDRFGHLLIPQKLQRDRFLKVLIDQQEYKDWRAARDQAG